MLNDFRFKISCGNFCWRFPSVLSGSLWPLSGGRWSPVTSAEELHDRQPGRVGRSFKFPALDGFPSAMWIWRSKKNHLLLFLKVCSLVFSSLPRRNAICDTGWPFGGYGVIQQTANQEKATASTCQGSYCLVMQGVVSGKSLAAQFGDFLIWDRFW